MKKGSVYIGTSGWMYKDWGERFYPSDLKKGHLSFFAQEFSTVEVNTSFYHLPLKSTFAKWSSEVPKDFVFAVKLSRYITHRKQLHAVGASVRRFMTRAQAMGHKLGVVLVQLPPSMRFNEKRLQQFVTLLTRYKTRFALEPRHQSWIDAGDSIKPLLHRHNVALVFPHSAKIPSFTAEESNRTADFIYVRFHGPSEFAASRYGARRLLPWAKRIRMWQRQGIDCFVYFNNDKHGHAIDDARVLRERVGL